MKFALGHTFKSEDMLQNFNVKRLKVSVKACKQMNGEHTKDNFIRKLFGYALSLIVMDIIERNVTFWFPLTGSRKCNLHMQKYTGARFKRLRQYGKWIDVDIIASNFAGYQIGFYMYGNRTPRVKPVYISKYLTKKITDNTNKGMPYGEGCIDTRIQDYFKDIQKKYTSLSDKDLKIILTYMFKQLYLLNSYGGDTLIQSKRFWFYVGRLKVDSIEWYKYYIRKLAVKLRIKYKRAHPNWDGYLYFSRTERQFQEYLQQKRFGCRPKKYFDFDNVMVYQIFDECKIMERRSRYFFRFKRPVAMNYKFFLKHLRENVELFSIQPYRKFKDILISNYNYEYL